MTVDWQPGKVGRQAGWQEAQSGQLASLGEVKRWAEGGTQLAAIFMHAKVEFGQVLRDYRKQLLPLQQAQLGSGVCADRDRQADIRTDGQFV